MVKLHITGSKFQTKVLSTVRGKREVRNKGARQGKVGSVVDGMKRPDDSPRIAKKGLVNADDDNSKGKFFTGAMTKAAHCKFEDSAEAIERDAPVKIRRKQRAKKRPVLINIDDMEDIPLDDYASEMIEHDADTCFPEMQIIGQVHVLDSSMKFAPEWEVDIDAFTAPELSYLLDSVYQAQASTVAIQKKTSEERDQMWEQSETFVIIPDDDDDFTSASVDISVDEDFSIIDERAIDAQASVRDDDSAWEKLTVGDSSMVSAAKVLSYKDAVQKGKPHCGLGSRRVDILQSIPGDSPFVHKVDTVVGSSQFPDETEGKLEPEMFDPFFMREGVKDSRGGKMSLRFKGHSRRMR